MARKSGPIPPSVIRRLTEYLTEALLLRRSGARWVSSRALAEILGLTSSTVRQDLSYLDFSGRSKRGYEVDRLAQALASTLGADSPWNMVVVGAGNLGQALARHQEFARRGFRIQGIFDSDARKIGRKVGSLVVRGMDALPEFVAACKAEIGIIAVPDSAGQSVADLLIASGVRGLLNLTSTHILAPRTVAVVDSRVVASLIELTHAIKWRSGGASPNAVPAGCAQTSAALRA